jgi:hypothetical protein
MEYFVPIYLPFTPHLMSMALAWSLVLALRSQMIRVGNSCYNIEIKLRFKVRFALATPEFQLNWCDAIYCRGQPCPHGQFYYVSVNVCPGGCRWEEVTSGRYIYVDVENTQSYTSLDPLG